MSDAFDRSIVESTAHRAWPMPSAPWLMTQSWNSLLFAHWRVDASQVRRAVPDAFDLDLFDGEAWLGVVPFYMTNVGVRAAPALPWLSAFPGSDRINSSSRNLGIITRTGVMAKVANIRVGTAGWSIPRATSSRFDSAGTHLERYSRRLDCAEINSSFHRPHAAATYAKWRESTPPGFRFAVKIPRAITHELKLRDAREPFVTFLAQTDGLADKRGPLLLQLPPSLSFDGPVVKAFLDEVRRVYDGPIVCEPRHATWFSPLVASLLERYRISRVAADPPPESDATTPAGWARVAYFRLHGSPRTYWSRYDENAIAALAATVGRISTAEQVWCVFDNTASGAAIENAWELRERLSGFNA